MPVTRKPGAGGLTLKTMATALDGLNGVTGKTGWFETAKYADGTPVAYVAAIQEFGAVAEGVLIPPRPTMRPAVADKGQEWMDLLGKGAVAVLKGQETPQSAMEKVALRAAGDVAKNIQALTSPPLAPSTIKAKGFAKPLVDTGLMLQSLTGVAEVKK